VTLLFLAVVICVEVAVCVVVSLSVVIVVVMFKLLHLVEIYTLTKLPAPFSLFLLYIHLNNATLS